MVDNATGNFANPESSKRKYISFADYVASMRDKSTQTNPIPIPSDCGHEPQSTPTPSPQKQPRSTQTPRKTPTTKGKATGTGDNQKQRKLSEWGFCQTNKTSSATQAATPSLSPTKSSAAKGKKNAEVKDDVVPTIPDEELRKSESFVIDPEQMINKRNLSRCYRLKGQFLKDVSLIGVKYEDRKISPSTLIEKAKTNLYLERDAEFQAWKMQGGRKKFVNYLFESYLSWEYEKSKDEVTFPIPNSYYTAFIRLWEKQTPRPRRGPCISAVRTAVPGPSEPAANSSSQSSSAGSSVPGPSQRKSRWPNVSEANTSKSQTATIQHPIGR